MAGVHKARLCVTLPSQCADADCTLPTPIHLCRQIDGHYEYYGAVADAWTNGGCASLRLTSILGDSAEDSICCTSGTCDGKSQFPCRADMAGDCAGAGGSAPAPAADDTANKRVATGMRTLQKGAQCGGAAFECSKYGPGQCRDGVWTNAKCASGMRCVRNDAKFWGCKA